MKIKTVSIARNSFEPHPGCIEIFRRMPTVRSRLRLVSLTDESVEKAQRLSPLIVTPSAKQNTYHYCSSSHWLTELSFRGKRQIYVLLLDEAESPVEWCMAALLVELTANCLPPLWTESVREVVREVLPKPTVSALFAKPVGSYRNWKEFTGTPVTSLANSAKSLAQVRNRTLEETLEEKL